MNFEIRTFLEQSNRIEGWGPQGMRGSMHAWDFLRRQRNMTEFIVLETHRLLMRNWDIEAAGKFRTQEVKKREYGSFVPWEAVPLCLNLWLNVIGEIRDRRIEDKDRLCESCHIHFQKIYPFERGTGVVGRMLWNWQRMCVFNLPPKIIWESEKQDYYQIFYDENRFKY
ncbi:MAG: Fic family protein [Deltaproteobacteria bacterium]|nr:Fic family protein [Deltaproteobacteria bacterium]